MNRITGERNDTHSCHTVQLTASRIRTEQAGFLWTVGLILLPRPSTKLIVIIFINRKHRSVVVVEVRDTSFHLHVVFIINDLINYPFG